MNSKIFSLGLLVFLALGFASSVHADLALTVETQSADAGDTVVVNVSAADPDGVGALSGYGFALDFGDAGLGLGPNLSFVNATNSVGNFNLFETAPGAGVAGANYDLQINAGAFFTPDLTLSAAPIELFSLEFAVGSGAAPSDFFDVRILPFGSSLPNELFVIAGTDIGTEASASISQGGISITAVPEPATASLIGFVVLAGLTVRRRQ